MGLEKNSEVGGRDFVEKRATIGMEREAWKAAYGGLGDDPPKGGVCPLFRAMASFK